ncbi:MAG: hypothetical protein P8101_07825 [Candidatus Thiodiazotropha sp.]
MDNKRCMTSVALRHADAKVSVLDSSRVGPWLFLCLVTGLLLAMMPRLLFADTATEYSSVGSLDEQQSLSIPLNKSRVIKLPRSLGRVSVRVQAIIGLQVTHDLAGLKQKLHRFLPDEKIEVTSSQGSIVLSGEVSGPQKMGAALDLAKTYAMKQAGAKGKDDSQILNLLQIGGAQQVMLEVKVAEISRSLVRKLDINFNVFSARSDWRLGAVNGGATFPDALISDPDLGDVRIPLLSDSGIWGPAASEFAPTEGAIGNTGVFMQYLSGDYLLELVIDAAKSKGLAKVLAEPNLTTLSGQEAKFISGGEFPIPVPQGDGGVTVGLGVGERQHLEARFRRRELLL